MRDCSGLRALIFDLDGTLYDSPELLAAYPRLAAEMIAERLSLPRAQAQERFEARREELRLAGGYSPPTTKVVVSLAGATLDEWGAFVAERVDPAAYLDPHAYGWLRHLLAALHRCYRLGLVSNNSRSLTVRILLHLGIEEYFGAILTTTESRRIKPDPSLFAQVAAMLDVPPEACLSIGDRLAVDVLPAQRAGMRGVVVCSPGELRALGAELLAAAGAHVPASEAVQG